METPPLLTVTLALPRELRSIPSVLEKVTDLLLPTTIDYAVANDLQLMVQSYGASRAWTVAAMDGAAANGRLDIVQRLHADRTEGCSVDAFVGASGNGHLGVVEWLVSNYGEVCIANNALIPAAVNDHLNVVEFLINHHKQTHSAEQDGASSFHRWISPANISLALDEAAANGHVELAKLLLREDFRALMNATVPICKALKGGHFDVVQMLLATKRYRIDDVLVRAARNGHLDIVSQFLAAGDAGTINRALISGSTHGYVAVVRALLDRVDPETIGSALENAAFAGQAATVQVLLDAWEDRPSKDPVKMHSMFCALKTAVLNGKVEVVTLLADRSGFYAVCPALRWAMVRNDITIVKVLVKRCTPGAIAHAAAEAAMRDQPKMVKLLLKNCDSLAMELVLEDVVSNDNAATAKAMLEKCSATKLGAILNEASARGCSALVGLIQDQRDEAKPGDEAASK